MIDRSTIFWKWPVMLIMLFILASLAVTAYLVELGRLVRHDRPLHAPRSHSHEIEPVTQPFGRL